jgi:peptidoglycan/xylan/chitin deacetylase (PgdA/CDA1 family)
MSEYLENRIDLPLGKSPVLLTFDDSIESQFRYLPDGSLDPNCALGILEAFHKEHPDFPTKATFFVLPSRLFDQSGLREQKLQELVDKGFDIGNHTVTHRLLRRLPDTEVQKEIASAADRLQKIAPKARIETLALPGGVLPRNQALLKSGQWEGISYTNQATFLAGAEPSPPPASKKFKPMRLPRVLAVEEPMGITYWLNMLRDTPGMRYISDGDPNTITVPKFKADTVEKARLQGKNLRTY